MPRPSVLITNRESRETKATPEYLCWYNIIARCYNPNHAKYRFWGGRGITVCPEWRDNFQAFLAHIGPRPSPKHSIDRIDNDGHYEPGNVRWATKDTQNRNMRSNVFIEVAGERLTIQEVMQRTGLSQRGLRNRINRGWPPEKLLDPVDPTFRRP